VRFKSQVRPGTAADTNSTVDGKLRRQWLRCSHCPPNKQENAGRCPKHGAKKPRRKNHRR
jgi:hypothetical protein